jgi:hypothetical protein
VDTERTWANFDSHKKGKSNKTAEEVGVILIILTSWYKSKKINNLMTFFYLIGLNKCTFL